MSAGPQTEEELREAEAERQNRADIVEEAKLHRDEYESLALIVVATVPLLIVGSLLFTMLGLTSHWWYVALIGLPWLGFYFYPLILLDRLKTPLRLPGGRMIGGKVRRKQLIIFAAIATAWLFRFEIFAQLERLFAGFFSGW